jgi:hypothetical protein
METLVKEVSKKETKARNVFLETNNHILNLAPGDSCDSSQVGHERTDSHGRILICTRDNSGRTTWHDSGRRR